MEKYPALRFLAFWLKFLGWSVLILGAVIFLIGIITISGASSDGPSVASGIGGVASLALGSALMLLGLLAASFGEIIRVFIDIEANTRGVASGPSITADYDQVDGQDSQQDMSEADIEAEMARRELERRGIRLDP